MTDKTKNILHNLVALASATILLLPDYLEVAPSAISQLESELGLLPRIPLVVKIGHALGVLMLAAVVGRRIVLFGRLLQKISTTTTPPAGAPQAEPQVDPVLVELVRK